MHIPNAMPLCNALESLKIETYINKSKSNVYDSFKSILSNEKLPIEKAKIEAQQTKAIN